MNLRCLLALAVLAAACTTPSPSPRSAAEPTGVVERRDPDAPVRVRWVTRVEPGAVTRHGQDTRLVLVARVEQPGQLGLPLAVWVEAPDGVTQTRGPRQYTVGPARAGSVHETEMEFAVDALPASDLVLVVDAQSPGAGFHARVPYRFGRPEPTVATPTLTGTPVTVGHTSAGPSVQMGGP
ncbi:MAG: hypothetical protein Q8S73_12275 [Deltaproteobacteria bacterium]|nr:hypothetical protein [Myxococcales bacterium]MDP3214875.1 hypothetical protein [Deltaproteobacteria bacterium]